MPKGAGFLLKANNESVGFIALRTLNYNTVEIKKFYVRPSTAYLRLSRKLLEVAIDWAMQSNYKKIRVESSGTHPSLKKVYAEADFKDRFIRDEATSELVRVQEKVLVSVPEYFQL